MAGGDLEIAIDVFPRETVQGDPRRDGMSGELGERCGERMVAAELDIAVRRHDDDATDGHLGGQVAKQQQRRLVRPMQIVEHEQQRLTLRCVLQERGDRVEEAEPRLLRLQRRRRLETDHPCRHLGNDLRDDRSTRAELGTQVVGIALVRVRPHDLHPRPVRRARRHFRSSGP